MRRNELPRYIGIMVAATFFTFFFHEMSHWIAYEILGYDAGFTLNGASVKDSSITLSQTHRMITSGAGPAFTILQGIVFYLIMSKHGNKMYYPFLFLPFFMRLGAGWANQFKPNDEGRISLALGWNLYTLSAIVVAFLLFLVIRISRKYRYPVAFQVITVVLSIIMLIAVTYLDSKYKIRFV
ncbi:MAG: hypothetical protein AAFO69_03725 [Bacteroidota bacterium]